MEQNQIKKAIEDNDKHVEDIKNKYAEKARKLFCSGYNCSQSVFAAFAEDLGLDTQTALKLSSSFGGGMGRMREVCGAVSGMFMVAGLLYGYDSPIAQDDKARHYKFIQGLAEEFKKRNGTNSIICRELLGISVKTESYIPEKRTETYYKKRPCADIVSDAAEIISKYMDKAEGSDVIID